MTVARAILLQLLVLLVLPWGAYAGGFPLSEGRTAAFVTRAAGDASGEFAAALQPPMQAYAMEAKSDRCPAAGLPGSGCGPDVLAPASATQWGLAANDTAADPRSMRLPQGLAPRVDTGPPRSG